MFMNNIGLNYAPKDIKILDMGTHFGFTSQFLKSEGFINVDSTNSFNEAGDMLVDLKKIWKIFDMSPMNIHIEPRKKFKLDKKYDIIFATMSNIFWKSNKIVRFHEGNVNQSWSITDGKGEINTFFVPYEIRDLDFFIKNILEYLELGGIAILQPYPYVYNTFDGFKEEANMLKLFQNPYISYEAPKSSVHSPNAELNNYFVIQKMKQI